MKRILIDLTSLDDNFSGMEHYALFQTKELIKNNNYSFDIVFKNKISRFSEEELNKPNIKVHILKGKRMVIMLFRLPKLIKKLKNDYALFLSFPPSIFLKRTKETKVISTIFDIVAFDMPETMTFKSRAYFKLAIKHALKISESIITDSVFAKNRICDAFNYSPNKVTVSYPSHAMPIIKKDKDYIANKYQLPNNYLLSLSTVEPRKNFKNLIIWLDHIWDKYNEVPDLVIAGRSGWKNNTIFKGIKHLDKIHFTGFIDDEDIFSIYSYSEAFLFPSLYEGFGMPVLEAIVASKLPICSDIPTSREILGEEYPFFFDKLSENDFEATLIDFLNTKTNDKNSLYKAIKEYISQFSWTKSNEKIVSILEGEGNGNRN